MSEKLDSTRTALVNKETFWKPITPQTPRGAKVFLINKAAKSATVGTIGGGEGFFTHYYPMPTFDPNEGAVTTTDSNGCDRTKGQCCGTCDPV